MAEHETTRPLPDRGPMKRLLLFIVSAYLLLSGCAPSSVHALYTDQDAVVEPDLEGTWSLVPDDKGELVFQKSGDHEYALAIFCTDTKVRQNYEVHLVRLGGQLFMDLIFKDQTVDETEVDGPLGVVPTHIIAKVKIARDDLAYAPPGGGCDPEAKHLGRHSAGLSDG